MPVLLIRTFLGVCRNSRDSSQKRGPVSYTHLDGYKRQAGGISVCRMVSETGWLRCQSGQTYGKLWLGSKVPGWYPGLCLSLIHIFCCSIAYVALNCNILFEKYIILIYQRNSCLLYTSRHCRETILHPTANTMRHQTAISRSRTVHLSLIHI